MSYLNHQGGREQLSALLPVYNRFSFTPVRGQGSLLWDEKDRAYIDLVAGIATNCLGHANQALQDVLKKQAARLWHVSNLYQIPESEAAARSLAEVTPMDAFFFCNSGTEANEGLLKLARRHGQKNLEGRTGIISMTGSFHGRTTGAARLTGQERIHSGFGPLLDDVYYATPNHGDEIVRIFDEKRPCAVLVEPILAEGGGIPLQSEYLDLLRSLCDEHNALLLFDEVQTGVGRTGDFVFANRLEQGFVDGMSLAKGLAGGFPAGAFAVLSKWQDLLEPGTHASTFGGNPLASVLIQKVVEIVSAETFIQETVAKGQLIAEVGDKWLADGVVSRCWGMGLWWIVDPIAPVAELEQKIRDKGVLVLPTQGRSLRLLPPLNIETELLQKALSVITEVLYENG